jgi:hypothetical protein
MDPETIWPLHSSIPRLALSGERLLARSWEDVAWSESCASSEVSGFNDSWGVSLSGWLEANKMDIRSAHT